MRSKLPGIAIVGMACKYPDAANTTALWENILSQRRAFRKMPGARLHASYFSDTHDDKIYATTAAVLSGYYFDRSKYGISGAAFRGTDLTHWLALDVATQALEDAGLLGNQLLPKDHTGVYVGNTLTGEFVRSNILRLRWPYVQGKVMEQLDKKNWAQDDIASFLQELEGSYKAPFPTLFEDSLAGGLSNTIAGRICNYYDLHGGGYTVDGACSSSLLAVIDACRQITSGDNQVCLAGGVDLSLDPFELVGFSRAGALARKEMLIYDKDANGFWPGEGCAFMVLADPEFALANNLKIYALIQGYGISTDGAGGLTRPTVSGQSLAQQRAYAKAGYSINDVVYFEGHGTGTAVGDQVELETIITNLQKNTADPSQHYIGSIKGNIGHTKAAAGIAGLLKAVLAVDHRMIPPVTGCRNKHPMLDNGPLTIPFEPIAYDAPGSMKASVSAMGFGGINTHVTIEEYIGKHKPRVQKAPKAIAQDCELFLFSADDQPSLIAQIQQVSAFADHISYAEMGDLSVTLQKKVQDSNVQHSSDNNPQHPSTKNVQHASTNNLQHASDNNPRPSSINTLRAAVVAATPAELSQRLTKLLEAIAADTPLLGSKEIYFYTGPAKKRIGFLFPGQGSKTFSRGARYAKAMPQLQIPGQYPVPTAPAGALSVIQPAVVGTSLMAAAMLKRLGIEGTALVGHSLGEIAAFSWSGVLSDDDALALAKERGEIMEQTPEIEGSMLIVAAAEEKVAALLTEQGRLPESPAAQENAAGQPSGLGKTNLEKTDPGKTGLEKTGLRKIGIAAINSPEQTTVSGPAAAIQELKASLATAGISSVLLPVKYAFHSPAMALTEDRFHTAVNKLTLADPVIKVFSTVNGATAHSPESIRENLVTQLRNPVRFLDAISKADQEVDWWIELGGDKTLLNIVKNISEKPIGAVMLDGDSLKGLYNVVAMAWVSGNAVELPLLYEGRFTRGFDLEQQPVFIGNPCEASPYAEQTLAQPAAEPNNTDTDTTSILYKFKLAVAQKLELPVSDIHASNKFLDDLHLNSLEVGQLIAKFAANHDLSLKTATTEFANASLTEVAAVLERSATDAGNKETHYTTGISPWVHYFKTRAVPTPLPSLTVHAVNAPPSSWTVINSNSVAEETTTQWNSNYPPEETKHWKDDGILLDLIGASEATCIQLLFTLKEKLQQSQDKKQIVVLQDRPLASGFIKSIYLESKQHRFLIINTPTAPDAAVLEAEIRNNTNFNEVTYDQGQRYTQVFEPVFQPETGGSIPFTSNDVILVSGGAKGITAECALSLGKRHGVKLLLLGRTDPAADPRLQNNLQRFDAAGITYEYHPVDITKTQELAAVIHAAQASLGTVTGFIHGAGINTPVSWQQLSKTQLMRTTGIKYQAFKDILDCLDKDRLKMLIGFGSIIAESGMNGNADYALANEWLRNEIQTFSDVYPACKCLNAAWSVWSGAGMGESLGVLENLLQAGVQPISLDKGIALFDSWMQAFPAGNNLIIAGRYGSKETIKQAASPVPFFRFIEEVTLYYPGIELISFFELAVHKDLYLKDHVVGDEYVFPAVMGLEAFQQAARVLCPDAEHFTFYETHFRHPIALGKDQTLKVQLVAQRIDANTLKMVLRCASTDYCKDHFETLIALNSTPAVIKKPASHEPVKPEMLVERDLYNNLLFHKGIFQVITHYEDLTAYTCTLKTKPVKAVRYFSDFMPATILSLSPVIRDAALHCVQACVPDWHLLPVGCEKLHTVQKLHALQHIASASFTITAIEIARDNNLYTYDLYILDEAGQLVECWEAASFRAYAPRKEMVLCTDLLRVIVERQINDAAPGAGNDFSFLSAPALLPFPQKRYDGKPLLETGYVARTHQDDITIQVHAATEIGCDLETVARQDERYWASQLGPERYRLASFVARQANEELAVACTRIWGIIESIKKADMHLLDTISFDRQETPSLQYYKCGGAIVLSICFQARETQKQTVFTLVLADAPKSTYNEKV